MALAAAHLPLPLNERAESSFRLATGRAGWSALPRNLLLLRCREKVARGFSFPAANDAALGCCLPRGIGASSPLR